MVFTNESMLSISTILQEELSKRDKVSFSILNPDYAQEVHAGTQISLEDKTYIYRGYKAWMDLCELLFCRMLTPTKINEHLVSLCFEKLNIEQSFHKTKAGNEKYGVESSFFQIHKNEEPAFLLPYKHALKNVKIQDRKRVLDLGVNSGDEFALIKELLKKEEYEKIELTGIDYSASAIAYAQDRFREKNVSFIEHDINTLDELNLGKFDLIISIGTFQSPNIDFKPFFMSLVQNYLNKGGAIILGFPNCRWMGGEMIYGAKVPNYAYSEMGMLYSDAIYCKKYLQQKKFRVTLTGKNYVFLTATKISQGGRKSDISLKN
ncbi:MAG: methyltransferase [Arcobacter sp.]|nr:MAG: methyltransferase [Arcobacter sp.]